MPARRGLRPSAVRCPPSPRFSRRGTGGPLRRPVPAAGAILRVILCPAGALRSVARGSAGCGWCATGGELLMTAPRPRTRQTKQLDAGMFQAEISSFALRLAAEGKAAKTIRTYTEAVQWFAAARLQVGRGGWEQVTSRDIQQ